MKKKYAYLAGAAMVLSSVFISQGCNKTENDDELIGNWRSSGDFDGPGRSEAVTFTIGDSVYIATGNTDRDRFKDLWIYSLSRGYWSQRADLPGPARNSAVGFAINGKGYLGTGYDGVTRLKDFYEYDPASNEWTAKAPFMGSGREDAVGFALGNKGYISCGYDGNYLKDLYQFDPANGPLGTWEQKASLGGTSGGSKRSAAMVFVVNDKAYICSGNNNGTALNDLWVYNGATDTWEEKNKITNVTDESFDDDYAIPRINGVAFVIGNYAYVTTGHNNSLVSTTWEYDIANDRWYQKTPFEGSAREGAVAFSLNNRGFVTMGRNLSLSFENSYEFQPTVEKNDNDN